MSFRWLHTASIHGTAYTNSQHPLPPDVVLNGPIRESLVSTPVVSLLLTICILVTAVDHVPNTMVCTM